MILAFLVHGKNRNESTIGVGAGKFLGVRRKFSGMVPNLPKYNSKKWPPKLQKKLGRHYFQIKACWAPVFQRVLKGSRRFSPDFRGFCPILWDFSRIFTKSKFWGCGCTPAPPPPTPVEGIIMLLQVEYVSTWLLAATSQYQAAGIKDCSCFRTRTAKCVSWHKQSTACGLLLGFRQSTYKIVDDEANRLACTMVVWQRKDALVICSSGCDLQMHTFPIIFWSILRYLYWQIQYHKLHVVNYGTRSEQSDPRNTFTAMARFHDLNLCVKIKTTG